MNYQNLVNQGIALIVLFLAVTASLVAGYTFGHVSAPGCLVGTLAAGVAAFVAWYSLIMPLYEVTDERDFLLDREKALVNRRMDPPTLEPDALTLNLLLKLAHEQKERSEHLTARIVALRVENQTLLASNRVLTHDLHAHRESKSRFC